MAAPTYLLNSPPLTGQIIEASKIPQFLVDQTPYFAPLILRDIRPVTGWLGNVATKPVEPGTPTEITQDRFRAVFPNVTKPWIREVANGPGCNDISRPEHQIGWGADRLSYFAEGQDWGTPLMHYRQDMYITHAREHIMQIVQDVLRPATSAIGSHYLRKGAHRIAKYAYQLDGENTDMTFQWVEDTNGDEVYFDCNANPDTTYLLSPQALQNEFDPLMREGYAGKNPFKETSPFIELVTDMQTCHNLSHMAGSGVTGGFYGNSPNMADNWRFTEWSAASKFWRYGFSGQLGNYAVRVDTENFRFNYIGDLGATAHSSNGNRYRYQIVLPYKNMITTGAGGAAGIGSIPNKDYDKAQFSTSIIWHKMAMNLLVPTGKPFNAETPYMHQDFGGKWQWVMDNLGADANGIIIENKRHDKGQFIARFSYYIEPLYTEFSRFWLHARERFAQPKVSPSVSYKTIGYPKQNYSSTPPQCTDPARGTAESGSSPWTAVWGTGPGAVPSGTGATALPAGTNGADGKEPTPVEMPNQVIGTKDTVTPTVSTTQTDDI